MYATLPYTLAVGSAEIPYLLCQLLVFVPVSYFMIGFVREAGSFFFFCLVFLSAIAMFTWMGQLLVFLTPSQVKLAPPLFVDLSLHAVTNETCSTITNHHLLSCDSIVDHCWASAATLTGS